MHGAEPWMPEALRGLGAATAFLLLFLGARYRWRGRGEKGGDSGLD
ncbi:hypothetical protein CLV92_106206 [Kineococcus xinjiangensis]|uniref:Uncharacterized protein n=1 Tax=Kineococcus xinjiangensis TaxID=512762 RepID=A0A2S6IMB3_9ACTN|nr:hypothetical protein [Kineococcus xinjiangensis]PPK95384.1 hypothetical protein CLV92_106206 [Kineococcus xinjiangensis]